MKLITLSTLLLFVVATQAQYTPEDRFTVKHTLEDFGLKGNVKSFKVTHYAMNYEGKEVLSGFPPKAHYHFNEDGKLTNMTEINSENGVNATMTLKYNEAGQLLHVEYDKSYSDYVINFNYGNDGVLNSISKTQYRTYYEKQFIYNELGDIERVKFKEMPISKQNGNVVVNINSTIEEKWTETWVYKYDKEGKVISIEKKYPERDNDDDFNGYGDNHVSYFEYHKNGNIAKMENKVEDEQEWYPRVKQTYNKDGKQVHYYEGDSITSPQIFSHDKYYYDKDGEMIASYNHYTGDGEFEYFNKFEHTRDEQGNWTEWKTLTKSTAIHRKLDDKKEKIDYKLNSRDVREIEYYEE